MTQLGTNSQPPSPPRVSAAPGRLSRGSSCRGGFTLLETMLALAVVLALGTLSVGLLYHAREVGRQVHEDLQTTAAARMIMARLTAELRGAVEATEFAGDSASLRFITAGAPPASAWEEPATFGGATHLGRHDLVVIGWRLRYDDLLPTGLERWVDPVIHARYTVIPDDLEADAGDLADQPGVQAFLVSDRLRHFSLRYWDGTQWLASWYDANPPMAVEVTLAANGHDDGFVQEAGGHVFRRVIQVPTGRRFELAGFDEFETGFDSEFDEDF